MERLEERVLLSAIGGPNPNETIDTTLTPAELAQSLVGAGVAVSNVTFTGGTASTGSFIFTDPTVVGFGTGIVMSSGSAADVIGPNLSDDTTTDFVAPGDPDLDVLSGFTTFDAAVLEFDFVPTANQVVFTYVFASDEYPEFVNTGFNDVFAFFVNGTNYAEVRQVAGDPTAPFVPVAVNNINNSNPIQDPAPAPMRPDLFRENYFNALGPSLIDLEYDGITTVLTFQAPVIPGELNHMKLAIADASDGILDSAVFIQSGSLVSNDNPVADLSLSPTQGAAPLAVTAIIEGEDPDGAPLTYSINWGDGTPPSTGPLNLPLDDSEKTALVDHTYTTGGNFIVTLTVSNGSLSGTSVEDVDVSGGGGPLTEVTFEGGTLTIVAVGDDSVEVSTVAGNVSVLVNGDPDTSIGTVASSAVTGIDVTGGSGDTLVDLTGVLAVDFTTLSGVLVDGGEGNDSLFGSDTADVLVGGDGDDSIEGNAGNDTLNGNADHDTLSGGDDSDRILGGAGRDMITGGAGDDTLRGHGADDTLDGGDGNDHVFGSVGDDIIYGSLGDDTLEGGDGRDRMLAGAGNDVLIGGTGNDTLRGHNGDDELHGEAGADYVDGGADFDCHDLDALDMVFSVETLC